MLWQLNWTGEVRIMRKNKLLTIWAVLVFAFLAIPLLIITVTAFGGGCGAAVIGKHGEKGIAQIAGITTGQVVDAGVRDSMNMGAAMAPAAFHTVMQNLKDLEITKEQLEGGWYDKIITGDLGKIGKQALADLLRNEGLEAEGFLMDCGVEIYDNQKQDTHAGGSGCGCSALVLGALILPNIQAGIWKRVLFVPTGALLSTVSFNEGQTIPGIAHGVILERMGK